MSSKLTFQNSLAYDERVFLCLFLRYYCSIHGSDIFIDNANAVMQEKADENTTTEYGVSFRVLVRKNLGSAGKENLKKSLGNYLPHFYNAYLPALSQDLKKEIGEAEMKLSMTNSEMEQMDLRHSIESARFDNDFLLCETEHDFVEMQARAAISASNYFEKRNKLLSEFEKENRHLSELRNNLMSVNRIFSSKFFIREIVQGKGFMRIFVKN